MVYDFAIIGAGFGGSLMGLILNRLGFDVLLVDRGQHPRFAIGESSTPIANMILKQLADCYDLPELATLAEYGSWKLHHPELGVGLKRGFSYFHHQAHETFQPSHEHRSELLVEASVGISDADTHWYRPDFDQFIAQLAVKAGVEYSDLTQVVVNPQGADWKLEGHRGQVPVAWKARFLIDASGEGAVLGRHFGIPSRVNQFHTNTRGLFSHFHGVPKWDLIQQFQRTQRLFPGESPHPFADHPYPCDAAALHHCFDGGWMWVLPFENGITSVGFSLDCRVFPTPVKQSPEEEWLAMLDRYPSVRSHMADAVNCLTMTQMGNSRSSEATPSAGRECYGTRSETRPVMIRSARMQRWSSQIVGRNWAMLPATAGFLDPLHSTGNAHTLSGIERLGALFSKHRLHVALPEFQQGLQEYEACLHAEVRLIDLIVHGCFRGMRHFPLFAAYSMLYFTAAIWAEHRRRNGLWQPTDAFLGATDREFVSIVEESHRDVDELAGRNHLSQNESDLFLQRMRHRIAPYNLADLCNPLRKNLYPFPK